MFYKYIPAQIIPIILVHRAAALLSLITKQYIHPSLATHAADQNHPLQDILITFPPVYSSW